MFVDIWIYKNRLIMLGIDLQKEYCEAENQIP